MRGEAKNNGQSCSYWLLVLASTLALGVNALYFLAVLFFAVPIVKEWLHNRKHNKVPCELSFLTSDMCTYVPLS